jgi:transposase
LQRLELAIDKALDEAPEELKAVVDGLQTLRGVARLTATTIAIEIGNFSRFQTAKQLMAYCGVVPSEHSSGASRRQGAITKTGNSHVRRVLFEAAWSYRHRPGLAGKLMQRQKGAAASTTEIAWKAQHRLHRRYIALSARGKPMTKVVGAIGRELLGFIWAIAVDVETQQQLKQKHARKVA